MLPNINTLTVPPRLVELCLGEVTGLCIDYVRETLASSGHADIYIAAAADGSNTVDCLLCIGDDVRTKAKIIIGEIEDEAPRANL